MSSQSLLSLRAATFVHSCKIPCVAGTPAGKDFPVCHEAQPTPPSGVVSYDSPLTEEPGSSRRM
jgi:hypothetical protein